MKRYTGLLIIAAMFMVTGCSDTPLQSVDDGLRAGDDVPIQGLVRNEVDILWVIDDSTSMSPFQIRLAEDLPALASRLGDPTLNADFSMAVVTVNTNRFAFRDTPQSAELERRPDLQALGCDQPRGPVLSARDYRDPASGEVDLDRLQRDFTCISAVGEDGSSGMEFGLETMRRALEATDTVNTQFLRADALLVVIFITDEDDCSHAPSVSGMNQSSCYHRSRYGDLTDVGDYEEALLLLKGADMDDPVSVQTARERILVLGLIGPPTVAGVLEPALVSGGHVEGRREAPAATCSGLFTGLAGLPDNCSTDSECGGGDNRCLQGECALQVTATSSYRYWDLMRRFVPSYKPFEEDNGFPAPPNTEFWEHDTLRFVPPANERPWRAICDSDYNPVLRALADQIAGALDINCVPTPPRSCESDSDCRDGVACILDQPQYGQCPISGLCEDFSLNIEFLGDGEWQRAEGALTAQEYCQRHAEASALGIEAGSTGGYAPTEGAQFWVNYAASCPHDIGFGFTSGNQPRDDDRFRLRYPVSISDDF